MPPLDPTPLLGPHYPPSSLVRVGPSQCSASVRSPRGGCHLGFSLGLGTTGSRSSTREPESGSRPLYAGRRPPSTPGLRRTLSQEIETPLVLTTSLWITTRPQGFTCVRLPDPHLLGVPPRRVDSNAHHRRLLTAAAWRGLEPAPGSRLRRAYLHLPCSLGTVSQLILNLLSVRLRRTVSRPGESHPRPLAERCGSLSAHTAPIKQTLPPSRGASERIAPGVSSRFLR